MNQRFCNGMVHVIKPGETLYQLSRYYRIPMAMLLRANPYVDVYNLQVGQEICIPVGRPVFPGMMPPFGRPSRRNMGNPPMQEPMTGGDESAVVTPPEEAMSDEMRDEMWRQTEEEIGTAPMVEEVPVEESEMRDDVKESQEMPYLIMDGQKSIGSMLREENMSLSEMMEMNNPDSLILAEGVRIYLPKKV